MTGQDAGSDVQPDRLQMQEGDDFVCPNCGCEIRLRHHGDPRRCSRWKRLSAVVAHVWKGTVAGTRQSEETLELAAARGPSAVPS